MKAFKFSELVLYVYNNIKMTEFKLYDDTTYIDHVDSGKMKTTTDVGDN